MPIDPTIPLQVRPPQFESYENALAKVLQIQGLQQQGELNRLNMDEKRRGFEQEQTMNQLYQSALKPDGTIDRSALYSGAASRGLGSRIPGLQKGFIEIDEKFGKVDADKFKLAKERYDYMRSTMGALSQEPNLTKDMVAQSGEALVQQGIIPRENYKQALASMPDDPQQLRDRLAQGLREQLSPEKIIELFSPKPEKMDNGQQIGFRDMNPNSPTYGQNTAGGVVQKVQSPDSVASVGASYANAAARREQAAATRDANVINRNAARTELRETADGFVMVDKGTGAITRLVGPDGKPLGPKLKDAPPGVQNAILGNAQNLARAERALKLVMGNDIGDPAKGGQKGDTAATGLKGYLPNQLLNRVDPQGVDARAAIADLGSLVIHDRSGAAVTAAEFPRLAPFIPTEKDDNATVKKKLQRFVQVYKEENAAFHGAYNQGTGYRPPGGAAAPASGGGQVLRFDADGNPVN